MIYLPIDGTLPLWSGSEPRQRLAQATSELTDHTARAHTGWEWLGTGATTGVKRAGRRVQLNETRETNGSGRDGQC